MALLTTGILGGVQGKVGSVVGGFWKGKPYIRAKVTPSNPNTEAQQIARANMSFIMSYGRANNDAILKDTFDYVTKGKKISPINKFVKVNLLNRVPEDQFAGTQWSEGNVTPVKISNAKYSTVDNNFTFDLDPNLTGYADGDDTIIVFLSHNKEAFVDILSSKAASVKRGVNSKVGTGMYRILSSTKTDGRPGNTLYAHAVAINSRGEASSTATALVEVIAIANPITVPWQ